MSVDWIKTRTDLYKDFQVIAIARNLMLQLDSNESNDSNKRVVTLSLLRNATVGCLVTVWEMARHHGRREEDDLVLDGLSVDVLDDVAEMDGFGRAMLKSTWLEETENGLKLPRFFRENNEQPSKKAKSNAERQREYRQRKKESKNKSNETVTRCNESNDREEKRREEKSIKDIEIEVGGSSRSDFIPPTPEQVDAYIAERRALNPHWPANKSLNGEWFCSHFGAQGWVSGNGIPIADWKLKVQVLGSTEPKHKSSAGTKPTTKFRAKRVE